MEAYAIEHGHRLLGAGVGRRVRHPLAEGVVMGVWRLRGR